MGLRERIMRALDRGPAPAVDPDAVVELTNVPYFEGPMVLSRLREAGIDAQGVEATSAGTRAMARDRMRIFVRDADLRRARRELRGPREPEPTPEAAALQEWEGVPGVEVRVRWIQTRGDRAEVTLEIDGQRDEYVYCVQREDGWHEVATSDTPRPGWDDSCID